MKTHCQKSARNKMRITNKSTIIVTERTQTWIDGYDVIPTDGGIRVNHSVRVHR